MRGSDMKRIPLSFLCLCQCLTLSKDQGPLHHTLNGLTHLSAPRYFSVEPSYTILVQAFVEWTDRLQRLRVRPAGLPLTSYATWHDICYSPFEDTASPIHGILELAYFTRNCHHFPHKFGFIVDARRKQYAVDPGELLPSGTTSSYYTSTQVLSACVGHWPRDTLTSHTPSTMF